MTGGPIIPGGMSCREVVELVTAYLDGALDREVVQRMDALQRANITKVGIATQEEPK